MPTPEITTIEEARSEIARLSEELTNTKTERDNYIAKVNELTETVESVREHNQYLFSKIKAQNAPETEPEADEPDVPSCEDFARTLSI